VDRAVKEFPDIRTEETWVSAARARADRAAAILMDEADTLHKHMAEIDNRVTELVQSLKRPRAARLAVLSILFRVWDLETPPSQGASELLSWLAAAGSEPSDNASRRSVFDFSSVPHMAGMKIDGAKAFHYQGSFTETPCMPVVRWFILSEPLAVYEEDILALYNASGIASIPLRTGSNGAGIARQPEGCSPHVSAVGEDIWCRGWLQRTPAKSPPLPDVHIESVLLSTDPFSEHAWRLSSDRVASLPWGYVRLYCGTFLVCTVLMLCTSCMLCAKNCCSD